jgi:tocopherol O-methyltransferase
MIACPRVTKRSIRRHYDQATLFYRLLWGRHIHHGLWEADESSESSEAAQRQLITWLATKADLRAGERVLDVGCGMGGTAIHLARHLGCHVTGLTLSSVQRGWAVASARLRGVGGQARFLCRDAETADFVPASFDVVWSLECTEHLFDKPRFFRRAAEWLRPAGRMALAAWLGGEEPLSRVQAHLVGSVCEGFLCPSLGSSRDYIRWMGEAGFDARFFDLSDKVTRTWEICIERVRRSRVRFMARAAGRDMTKFLDHFVVILEAYRTGAMKYGCFVGTL